MSLRNQSASRIADAEKAPKPTQTTPAKVSQTAEKTAVRPPSASIGAEIALAELIPVKSDSAARAGELADAAANEMENRLKNLGRCKVRTADDISPDVMEIIRLGRRSVRLDEIGRDTEDAGQCGFVSELLMVKLGLEMEAGFYLISEAPGHEGHADHVWNVLPDGTILDATHGQFGGESIAVLPEGDELREKYHSFCGQHGCPHCGCTHCNPGFAEEGDNQRDPAHVPE